MPRHAVNADAVLRLVEYESRPLRLRQGTADQMAGTRLAIPSFFEIKESGRTRKLSEKNRICFFLKPRFDCYLNAAREPKSLPSKSRESRVGLWPLRDPRALHFKRPISF